MAILKTDRERRIQGDRIVAQRESFSGVHSAVEEVHGIFTQSHAEFKGTLEERQREETEDAAARELRETSTAQLLDIYSWGYNQVDNLLQPSWKSAKSDESPETVRARLFPMGAPGDAGRSSQLILDAATHFLAALARETRVAYPPDFVNDAKEALSALKTAVAKVTVESGETRDAVSEVETTRNNWDNTYVALQDVTRGFLRLNDELDRFGVLFQTLPKSSSKITTDTASESHDSADETFVVLTNKSQNEQ